MKKIHKAFLFLSLPGTSAAALTALFAHSGKTREALGAGLGSAVVLLFALTWFLSANRLSLSNVMKFIKVFALLFLGKLALLVLILILSVSVIQSDRFYFTMAFCLTTLAVMPIEIWFGLSRGKDHE